MEISNQGVRFGITTRKTASSKNWDFHLRDLRVFENSLQELADDLDIGKEQIICGRQPHGTNILLVSSLSPHFYLREGYDGLMTNREDVVLATFHADCVPIYFYDPKHRAIGMAHGGWRGTVSGIAGKMVEAMKREFDTNPDDLMVWIGPCISQKGYEVDEPVIQAFQDTTGSVGLQKHGAGHAYLDLAKVNQEILERKGVDRRNIFVDSRKTDRNPTLFYSHRREGKDAGRMLAWITLEDVIGNRCIKNE